MKIAVCEDSRADLTTITDLLDKYMASADNNFQYDSFSDYAQLEGKESEYDLFILDYMMPGKNGLDYSRELYKRFKSSKSIIFITAYPEIVYDTFEVNTFRFLVKPIDEEKFNKALDDYFKNNADSKLVVKVGGKNFTLDLNSVTCFESQGRKIIAHCLTGENIEFYGKTSDLDKALSGEDFFRVHRSYTVRFDKVKTFSCNEILLENVEKVSVSSKKYYDFCEAYLKYIRRSHL